MVQGKEITTIEGLAKHVLAQDAFVCSVDFLGVDQFNLCCLDVAGRAVVDDLLSFGNASDFD